MDRITQRPYADAAAISRAAKLLRAGGVVALPTETVYGLGADAFNVSAVARVFAIKDRPRFDPLIVHVADSDAARGITAYFPPLAGRLADAFWPGPLTLVLPKQPQVPDLVTAGLPTVAVRVPDHPVALALINEASCPLAAPSANRFGSISPTTAAHVLSELGDEVAMVLDGGPCRAGVESTVISLVDPTSRPTILRLGGLPLEAIRQIVGPVQMAATDNDETKQAKAGLASPGMLQRHYAPRTALRLVDKIDTIAMTDPQSDRVGLLCFQKSDAHAERFAMVEILSPTSDLGEAAANLFAAMRRLDDAQLDLIVAQRVPDTGLGRAINDRLTRASRSSS